MDDDNIGSDVPLVKPVEFDGGEDCWDVTPEEGVDDEVPDNRDFWERIRLEQPNKKLPRSFFDRQKLAFLACFNNRPRLKWLFRKLQFLNIIFALAGFYLLVCFLFPVLLQLGYASACEDMGLDYVMQYHKCFDPIELEFGFNPYPELSKYDVLFQTISLDYGKMLDADISGGNVLRDVERERLESESNSSDIYDVLDSLFLDSFVLGNESNLSVKVEDEIELDVGGVG